MVAHFLFLGYPYILIVHVTYAIYIVNVCHSVNLTLSTVTSIHSVRKMDQR